MKPLSKYLYLSLLFVLCSLLLTNCENYIRTPQGEIKQTAPVLKMAQSNVWLRDSTEEFVDKFLMRINWTEARFTYENGVVAEVGAITYVLEMDTTADFTAPKIFAETNGLFTDLFSGKLRDELLGWYGSEIDTTKYISFRVKTLCENFEPTFSNILALKVDPTKPNDTIIIIPEIPDVTIRVRKSAECTWANIWVYAWGTNPDAEIFGGWGGKKLTEDEEGWYSFVVTGIRPIHLILHNGAGNQFDFIDDPTEDGCYEIINTTYAKVDCE